MKKSRIKGVVTNIIKDNEDEIKDLRNRLSKQEVQNYSLKVLRSSFLWISGTILVPFIIWHLII